MDHNVPIERLADRDLRRPAKAQLDALAVNVEEFGVPINATGSGREGIVHVMGPELGLTPAGDDDRRGDSLQHLDHLPALSAPSPSGLGNFRGPKPAATQTLLVVRSKTMLVRFARAALRRDHQRRWLRSAGDRPDRGRAAGPATRSSTWARRSRRLDGRPDDDLQHVDRGRRAAGMIAPDETTFAYLGFGRPAGACAETPEAWRTLAPLRPGAELRPRRRDRRDRAHPAGDVGDEPGHGRAGRRPRSRPG